MDRDFSEIAIEIGRHLRDSEAAVDDMNVRGNEILHDLQDQGSTIRRIRSKLRSVDASIETANRAVRRMLCTNSQKKITTMAVILFLLFMLSIIIYIIWIFPWPFQ